MTCLYSRDNQTGTHQRESMHELMLSKVILKQSSLSRLYGSKMYRDANQGTVLIQAKDKASKPKVQIWGYFELSR